MSQNFCQVCNRRSSGKLSQGQVTGGIILLLFFFILPGILYFLLAKRRTCVTCGSFLVDHDLKDAEENNL